MFSAYPVCWLFSERPVKSLPDYTGITHGDHTLLRTRKIPVASRAGAYWCKNFLAGPKPRNDTGQVLVCFLDRYGWFDDSGVEDAIMTKIYLLSPGPDAWKQFLAEPDKQWKKGYSARTLAHSWEAEDGLPPEIAELFAGAAGFQGEAPELLLAIPEHKVRLPGGRRESQNDVFALVRIGDRTVSMAVEGKVNEPFGPTVGEWLTNASDGKRERMAFLCKTLGISDSPPADIHYQLLHRAASAVIEADRFKTDAAAMIVHSFSPEQMWFDTFARFVGLYEHSIEPGQLVEVSLPSGMPLFLGWVCGDPRFLRA